MPDEPSVLSNLGLSYMLTQELPKAEETLRRAYANRRADARVRQNLALVVGLQGRFAEAETIVKADLPADEAAANVAYLQGDAEPQGQPARQRRRDAGRRAQPARLIAPSDSTFEAPLATRLIANARARRGAGRSARSLA